jgi:hypothetical protein
MLCAIKTKIYELELFGNIKLPNNFHMKTQNAMHFARTWATTNRDGEQVHYAPHPRGAA